MPTFDNLKSLQNYIRKNNKSVLHQIGLEIEEEMKQYIMKELYQKYSPEDYARTYDYINSLTVSSVKESSSGYVIEIFFDANKISARSVSDRYWNQHMSIDGDDFSKHIPYIVEYGTNGSLHDREGIRVVEKTVEDLKQGDLIKKARNILKSKGFDIVLR